MELTFTGSVPSLFANKAYSERVFSKIYASKIQFGSLTIIDAFGQSYHMGNGRSPVVRVRLLDKKLHHKLLWNPSIHFGEAYMNGNIVFEEGNLKDFFSLIFQNIQGSRAFYPNFFKKFQDNLQKYWQVNSIGAATKNAKYHYDLPAGFYDLFLDQDRQYSCAYFDEGTNSLDEAQINKMKLITNKLLINPKHHVLDIGCGWGGLSCYIAKTTGAKVTGITLSSEQLKEARRLARKNNLAHRVNFELMDYRNIDVTYDRIVSVGMFEHVGAHHFGEFFRKARGALSSQGIMLLHSIGRANGPSETDPWIKKYIFPGGYIPALSEVLPEAEKSGLYVTDIEILRGHYAKTLKIWRERFLKNYDQALGMYNQKFCRVWELYLASSEASFEYLDHMVFHLQLAPNPMIVPSSRDYLYSPSEGKNAA